MAIRPALFRGGKGGGGTEMSYDVVLENQGLGPFSVVEATTTWRLRADLQPPTGPWLAAWATRSLLGGDSRTLIPSTRRTYTVALSRATLEANGVSPPDPARFEVLFRFMCRGPAGEPQSCELLRWPQDKGS